MTESQLLVSYIVPCYNQGKFLYESISSAMLSYTGPKEIIIIDDCSTDLSSLTKLDEVQKLFPFVKIIRQTKNMGLSATRNVGLKLSTGDYIQFLDADDLLFPNKVDYQIQHFALGNNIDISISNFYVYDATLSEYFTINPGLETFDLRLEDFLFNWERGMIIPIHSALFRKDVFIDIRFDESLSGKEDWLFWCRQSYTKMKMSYINILGAAYRTHPNAMTKKKLREMGRMWLLAGLKIDELIKSKDNHFLTETLSWYHCHYEQDTDIEILDDNSSDLLKENNVLRSASKFLISRRNISQTEEHESPFFSVVIPVHNHYEFLFKCLDSVFSQTYLNFELICVDDNSSDLRVKHFLTKLNQNNSIIKVILNPENEGIANSLNKAINIASGQYIAFLDCDDFISEDALEQVYIILREQPGVDYVFSDKTEIDENDQSIRFAPYGGYPKIQPSGDIKSDLLDGMVASHLKVIRKSSILGVGGFDPEIDGVQDYDLALKIAEKGFLQYIPKPLYFHRQHPNSVTKVETVNQFRKTNIVRRRISERWCSKKENSKENFDLAVKKIFANDPSVTDYSLDQKIALFTPDNFSLPAIKLRTGEGYSCVFDARHSIIGDWAYFLREYNSYFDLIIVDDPHLSIFLIGYLYDYNILHVSVPDFN